MSYWSVCRSEPAREKVAAHFLQQAGYVVYNPRIEIAAHGRTRAKIAQLFPSYLFIKIDASWWTARWCNGVNQLLLRNGTPARLSDRIVEAIKQREDDDGLIRLASPTPALRALKPGDGVRIVRGSFENHFGNFEGMTGAERSEVLLTLMGREVKVTLSSRDLEPAI